MHVIGLREESVVPREPTENMHAEDISAHSKVLALFLHSDKQTGPQYSTEQSRLYLVKVSHMFTAFDAVQCVNVCVCVLCPI